MQMHNDQESRHIVIDLARQRLRLYSGNDLLQRYPVSTGRNGPGEEYGSGCTPRGRHVIRARIGAGEPENSVFVGRRPTGERYTPRLRELQPARDWVLTRVLWLSGREPGFNRGGSRDTLRRFIYIHGCPDSEPLGEPRSHGCIRMRNRELIALFDQVTVGTAVDIRERWDG